MKLHVTVHLQYGGTVAAVLFECGGKVYGNICMRDSSSVVNISYMKLHVTVHLQYGTTVAAVLFEFGGRRDDMEVYGNICMRH